MTRQPFWVILCHLPGRVRKRASDEELIDKREEKTRKKMRKKGMTVQEQKKYTKIHFHPKGLIFFTSP